ncbi:MAG TPA: DUF5329 family protein [Urbifossiella sp.]|nr:DUF5329 family protein [Urbifossiella sp.]
MARILTAGGGLALALAVALNPARAQETGKTEKQKIEALIKHVEGLDGAKFVRNDKEYDAKSAARFLRGKWEADEAGIKTAKDFVDKAASVSSSSGKAYLIRLKDGKEVKSGEYLLAELKKLEKAP